MKSSPRSGLIGALLLLTLVLAAILAFQAQVSVRYHRAAAEKLLRDYAMLASDEFARRTANELGFSGFYPLMTALRHAGPGRLVSPKELETNADEAARKARDLVRFTFLYDPRTGRLEISGKEPEPAVRAWIAERLAAPGGAAAADRRYQTLHADAGGSLHSLVFGPAEPRAGSPIVGFEAEGAAFVARFERALARGPLFPASLARGAVGNEALCLRVLDPKGREVYRAGSPREPYLGVERPFGSDYNGMLEGFVVHAAVDPAAARSLVIGGLPRSRLPFLLGLLALTAGLILTAVLQLRRERALSRLRSDFVSRVSHELRTPLTQIRMFAETLLLDRVRSEGERRRALEIIDRESRRLANLVENVLRFSRGERGEDRVEPAVRDVVPLVRELLLDFEPLAGGRARLVVSLPDHAAALVDEDALRRMLLNLLDNALKYGPAGQEIRLAVETRGESVRFTVEDEGPGIPVRERDRVWERFYRMARDRDSAVAGTGIGLAVVRDLARLHGGGAWAEDGEGRGARFVLELPATPVAGVVP